MRVRSAHRRPGVDSPPMASIAKGDRSRRAELQRLLGDNGEILPWRARGTPTLRAAGWYARMADGKLRFLGDHTPVAMEAIRRLADPSSVPDASLTHE